MESVEAVVVVEEVVVVVVVADLKVAIGREDVGFC